MNRFAIVFSLIFLPVWLYAQDKALVEKATAGDPVAQFELGLKYYNGRGVPQNTQEAFRLWKEAAQKGNAMAQNNLGVMYRKGRGVPRDSLKAYEWFQKAAVQGYIIAQSNLLDWWEKEAQAGNVSAQFNLGALYHRGTSVPKDFTKAYAWYAISAHNGDKDGQEWSDYMASTLQPKDIAQAKKFIDQWLKTFVSSTHEEQKP